MNESDHDDVVALRAKLQAAVRRDQKTVYSSMWLAGTGAMIGIIGGGIVTLALVPGVIVVAAGALMLSVGVVRVREGFQRISEVTHELEGIEPRPLPPARIV